MAKPVPSPNPGKPGSEAPSGAPPFNPDIDEGLLALWQKYGQTALIAVVLVLVFLLARTGWGYWQDQRAAGVRADFALATTPEELRAFAVAHPDQPLAGVANLEIADRDYTSGQMASAVTEYSDAARLLKGGPLADRAEIGAAMAKIQSGDTAGGRQDLEGILNNAGKLAAVRAQAGTQLASLAAAQSQWGQVTKLALQVMQIDTDPQSFWASQAEALMAKAEAATPASVSAK